MTFLVLLDSDTVSMNHHLCVRRICTLDLWVQLSVSVNWAVLDAIPHRWGRETLAVLSEWCVQAHWTSPAGGRNEIPSKRFSCSGILRGGDTCYTFPLQIPLKLYFFFFSSACLCPCINERLCVLAHVAVWIGYLCDFMCRRLRGLCARVCIDLSAFLCL